MKKVLRIALATLSMGLGINFIVPVPSQATSLVANWNVGGNPGDLVVSADGQTLYAVDSNNNNLVKVNTASGSATTLAVGSNPTRLALTPNGNYVLVVNNNSNTVSVVSTSSFTVSATIAVCSSPSRIAVDPAGAFAYLTCGNSVQKIDLSTLVIAGSLSVSNADAIAIDHSGTYMYVVSYGSNNATEIALSTFSIVKTFYLNNGTTSIVIDPTDTYIYDVNQDGYLKWDPIPGGSPNSYSHLAGYLANSLSIDSSGSTIYAVNPGDGTVSVIDVPSKNQFSSISIPHTPNYGALSQDNQYLYVSETNDGYIAKIKTDALEAPAFTLSSSSLSVTAGSAISSYSINSTGGTIATFSISPAISNGTLAFDTTTGLLSGTPTNSANATVYTITAHNATSPDATQTFTLTINAAFTAVFAPTKAPDQRSTIVNFSPETSTYGSPVNVRVTGNFPEKISAISLNGINLATGSWVQTSTSVTLLINHYQLGENRIQIFNGSVPLLAEQVLQILPAPKVQQAGNSSPAHSAISYIECKKAKGSLRIYYGVNPICPNGYQLFKKI